MPLGWRISAPGIKTQKERTGGGRNKIAEGYILVSRLLIRKERGRIDTRIDTAVAVKQNSEITLCSR